jgi:hypothetical protein
MASICANISEFSNRFGRFDRRRRIKACTGAAAIIS